MTMVFINVVGSQGGGMSVQLSNKLLAQLGKERFSRFLRAFPSDADGWILAQDWTTDKAEALARSMALSSKCQSFDPALPVESVGCWVLKGGFPHIYVWSPRSATQETLSQVQSALNELILERVSSPMVHMQQV